MANFKIILTSLFPSHRSTVNSIDFTLIDYSLHQTLGTLSKNACVTDSFTTLRGPSFRTRPDSSTEFCSCFFHKLASSRSPPICSQTGVPKWVLPTYIPSCVAHLCFWALNTINNYIYIFPDCPTPILCLPATPVWLSNRQLKTCPKPNS